MTLLYVENSSIDKGLFAKIVLRQYVVYENHSGNVQKVSSSEFINGIEFDTTENITPVRKFDLASVTANGNWYWDRDAGKVYFYYDDDNDLYNVVLKIAIFVTTTFDVLAPAYLENDQYTDKTIWEGRLKETSFSQSIEDILNGKFGIVTTSINIINNDSRYNYYANLTTSFKNAEVLVWIVINEIANKKLIFKGVCESCQFNGSDLSLSIIESTKVLQQEATFGDSSLWSTINKDTWPSSLDTDQNTVIPFFLAGSSKKTAIKTKSAFYSTDESGERAVIKNYDFYDVNSETDFPLKYCGTADPFFDILPGGKKYIVCRCPYNEFPQNFHLFTDESTTPLLIDGIANNDITLVQSNFLGIAGTQYAEYLVEAKSTNVNRIKLLYAGMLVYLENDTGNVFHSMIVTSVDTVNKKFGLRHFSGISTSSIKVTSNVYKLRYRGPTVYTKIGNTPVYLDYKNYNFRFEQTDGANNLIYCVVTNDYRGTSYEYLNGNNVNMFRLYSDDLGWQISDVPDLEYYCRFLNFKVVEDLSEYDVGETLNFATRKCKGLVTDSNADMVVAGNSYWDFKVKIGNGEYIDIISPDIGSKEQETYLTVIEKILASTMSFMCLDNDGKLIVRLFENEPYNSILLTLSEDDIKDGSISSDIDFSEIAASIVANPEFSQDSTVKSSSKRNQRISGDIKFNFNHILKSSATYSSAVKARLDAYKLNPIRIYNFTVINKGYELTLGDRINLSFPNSGKWLGTDDTKSLFVIRLNKSLSGVQVTAIENIFP